MFVDNFSSRNAMNVGADQSQVSTFSFYIDAFMTLDFLSNDPKIDIKRVGITGWSRGGMNSLAIAETRIRDALVSKDLYFAASIPRSVECRQSGFFRNPQPIKETKIWMINGKNDDASLAHICEEYGNKMKANGADIKVTTKKGWGHGFEANYEAEYEIERFIKVYPNQENIPYAHYLLGMVHYERIVDEKKDLGPLVKAEEKFKFIEKNYPNTDFALDASYKLDLINDYLASKDCLLYTSDAADE